MHIGPTTDQLHLRDTMRQVLAAECPISLTRAAHTDHHVWQSFWKTTIELGWTSLALRGLDDELELSTLDLVLALEAFGSALAPAPFVSSVGLAAGAARTGGAAMAAVLTEIAAGSVATLAAQRADRRLPQTPMTLCGGRIQGTAVAVPDAVYADLVVVLCTDGDTESIAAVRVGENLVIDPVESADPSRPLATIVADAVPEVVVPARAEAALAPAWVAVAAELVGVAQGALDLAVDHARNRRQFDRAIGSYQGVKHALADNVVAVERARSLVYLAAARLDTAAIDAESAWSACALAKAAAGDAALRCSQTAVQVFGALGQTWEHDIHLFLRRAWVGSAQLGDSSSLYAVAGQRFLTGVPR